MADQYKYKLIIKEKVDDKWINIFEQEENDDYNFIKDIYDDIDNMYDFDKDNSDYMVELYSIHKRTGDSYLDNAKSYDKYRKEWVGR